jgi:ribosomal protein S18 acetylase RimI-like enzyme
MNLNIRLARHEDISDILCIEQSIERDAPASRQTLVGRLEMFPDGFLVANNDLQLIGYIESCIFNEHPFSKYDDIRHFSTIHYLNGAILFIIFIGVDERFQKMGVGSSLINVLKKKIQLKYPHIQKIHLVSKERYVNSFYRKNGFRIIKPLPDYMPSYAGMLMEYQYHNDRL